MADQIEKFFKTFANKLIAVKVYRHFLEMHYFIHLNFLLAVLNNFCLY